MSHKPKPSLADPAKSLVGPLEELYLVSFLAEGDDQDKIEKALRAWTDKWLCSLEKTEAIDQAALKALSPQEQNDLQREILTKAKQQLGEAMASGCANFREGPLNDLNTYETGTPSTINYRHYSLMAVRRWER